MPGLTAQWSPSAVGPPGNDAARYKDFPPGWGHIKVPMSSRRAARAALALYGPSGARGVWAQRAATIAVAVFGPGALPGRAFAWTPVGGPEWPALAEVLERELGSFDEVAGYDRLQVTRRGVAVLLLRDGAPLAFVKLGRGDDADLSNETRAMQAVWHHRPRSFLAPQPLAAGSTGPWHYLASAPLPPGLHGPARRPPLADVLADIDTALGSLPRSSETPAHWRPMHGDFAPWNLRTLAGGGLALIDWEAAGWGPPGADRVFYEATSAALGRRRPAPCDMYEAVEFWRQRVVAGPGASRDDRLARRLHQALRQMTRQGGVKASGGWELPGSRSDPQLDASHHGDRGRP